MTRCQDLRLLVGIVTPEVAAVQRATSTDAKDPTQTASANQRLGHSTDPAVLEPSRGRCSPGEDAEQPCGTRSQDGGWDL